MDKYYQITAKCGHVGKNNYIPIDFFVKAESASAAAALVRFAPRVKHHHKDAILAAQEIDYDTYRQGNLTYNADPYIHCRNRQEQNLIASLLKDRILPECPVNLWESVRNTVSRNPKRSFRYGYTSDNRLITKSPIPSWELGYIS